MAKKSPPPLQPPDDVPTEKPRRGRGRPTDMCRAMLEGLCLARLMGMSVTRAARSQYITRATYYAWLQRGLEDKATGRRTLYAEFSDRVPYEEARGEYVLLKRAHRGSRTGKPEHVAAGKLAMDVLKATRSGRYGQQVRQGRPGEEAPGGEGGVAPPSPAEEVPAPDLSRLSREELASFRHLMRKARGLPDAGT